MDGNNPINVNQAKFNNYQQNTTGREAREFSTEVNSIFGNLDEVGSAEYTSIEGTRAEYSISNEILSEKAVTLSESQQKELLRESGIEADNYLSVKAEDGTVSFMIQEGDFIRVVNDNDEVKIIHTTINGDKASTEVYKNDKPKSDYSKFKSDENGNLNATQKSALAEDISNGKLTVFLNKDEKGNYHKNPIMTELNKETYDAVWQEVASISAGNKADNAKAGGNKTNEKYSQFKPDENGNYTDKQMKALVEGYRKGTPEFNPHNPDAVYFNVGDAKLYDKVRDAVIEDDKKYKPHDKNAKVDEKYSQFKPDENGKYTDEQLNELVAGYLHGTPEFDPHNPDAVYFNVGDPSLLNKIEDVIEQINAKTDGALRAEYFDKNGNLKAKDVYSQFRPDENGNYTDEQMQALVEGYKEGTPEFNPHNPDAVYFNVGDAKLYDKVRDAANEENKTNKPHDKNAKVDEKYSQFKPDENGKYTDEQIDTLVAGYLRGTPEFDPHNPDAVYFNVGDSSLLNKIQKKIDEMNSQTDGALRAENFENKSTDIYSQFRPDENGNYTDEQMQALVEGYKEGTPEFNPHNPDAVYFNVGDAKLYDKVRAAADQENRTADIYRGEAQIQTEEEQKDVQITGHDDAYSQYRPDENANYTDEQMQALVEGYKEGTPEFNPHNPDSVYYNVGDSELHEKVRDAVNQEDATVNQAENVENRHEEVQTEQEEIQAAPEKEANYDVQTTGQNDSYAQYRPDENGNYTQEQVEAIVEGYRQGTPEFDPHNPDAIYFNVGDPELLNKVQNTIDALEGNNQ